jgi:molybdopterin-containing oxidoreductase family membrane subunit
MLENIFRGDKRYWAWLFFLGAVIGVGTLTYLYQLNQGLGVTGLSRDVSWGLYIAQFTFLVGVAASAVMVVLPYYLHNYKAFGKITILGEFLAVGAVIMCQLFVFVDMGQPFRLLNLFLHPTPNSVMFWDIIVLTGYLVINIVIGWTALTAEQKQVPPPFWVKPLIYLSIPWAVSIHTVTAFLYAGLPGRHLWLTAIMAARFLASAFAAGPSLLVLFIFVLRRVSSFKVTRDPVQKLAQIVAYAMFLNLFFLALEFFTAFYSGIPGHESSLLYLFFGFEGHSALVPWMWTSLFLGLTGLSLLVFPLTRRNEKILPFALAAVFFGSWIDKGLGLVVGGFIPSPLEKVTEYAPTLPELTISIGVYAVGLLVITVLYKIAVGVRKELALPTPRAKAAAAEAARV